MLISKEATILISVLILAIGGAWMASLMATDEPDCFKAAVSARSQEIDAGIEDLKEFAEPRTWRSSEDPNIILYRDSVDGIVKAGGYEIEPNEPIFILRDAPEEHSHDYGYDEVTIVIDCPCGAHLSCPQRGVEYCLVCSQCDRLFSFAWRGIEYYLNEEGVYSEPYKEIEQRVKALEERIYADPENAIVLEGE